MKTAVSTLKSGDWVEVKSPDEIAHTLDQNGTFDGLPFMPEMLPLCGQRFQVSRRVEKSCVECDGGEYKIREFVRNDVVLLEGLRCSGSDHGGCQRGCLVFWRAAWLRKVEDNHPTTTAASNLTGREELRSRLKTMSAPDLYFCQSTEMQKITQPQTRMGILLKCFYDVRSGSRRPLEMLRLILGPIWRKIFPRALVGSLTKTPVGRLELKPGEIVELKSPQQIAETLDAKGRNRGLLLDYNAVCKFGGGRYRVRTRIDRMINEATGKMCKLDNTVILDEVSCTCHSVVGGCPRQDPVFWREIWLKRVTTATTDTGNPLPETQAAQIRPGDKPALPAPHFTV